ncbi:MAG: DbpA RNA binding domain-containing protein [Acidobacteriota bacterium]|nr:DbpA RNA binding domain-containing protein [Acidobacteriota bacterium]
MLKERILKTLNNEGLDPYLSLVEELAEESGRDVAEIAAATANLAGSDKPPEVTMEPEAEWLAQPEDGPVRLFVDVGRRSNVGPSDIVGAIANEAGVPGKVIGAIDVYDRFTLVDVPPEYVEQVLGRMKGSRIRNHNANVRVAAPRDVSGAAPRPAGTVKSGGKKRGNEKVRPKNGSKKGKKSSKR